MKSFEKAPSWSYLHNLMSIVAEGIPVAASVFDAEGKLITLNRKFIHILGKSRHELLGESLFHNSNFRRLGLDSFFKELSQNTPGEIGASLCHRLNGYFLDITPFYDTGDLSGMLVTIAKAEPARKEEEERRHESSELERAFASIFDGLMIVDPHFAITHLDVGIGLAPQSAVRDLQCHKVVCERDSVCTGCPVADAFQLNKICRARVQAGKLFDHALMEVIAVPLLKTTNPHVVVVMKKLETAQAARNEPALSPKPLDRAVAEGVNRERLLAEIGRHALAAGRDESITLDSPPPARKVRGAHSLLDKRSCFADLASAVTHHVNVPLLKINTCIDRMSRRDISHTDRNDIESDLNHIKEAVTDVAGVTSELLSFTAPSEKDYALVNINTVLENALAVSKVYAEKSRIYVTRQFALAPASVRGNARNLEACFCNILNNAVEAMNGEGRLSISTYLPAHKRTIGVTITDTGSGITSDHLERIFEPFFTTKKYRGAQGLGLSFSYAILIEHGGTIKAESEKGFGTTVTVELPLVTAQVMQRSEKPDSKAPLKPPLKPYAQAPARKKTAEIIEVTEELLAYFH